MIESMQRGRKVKYHKLKLVLIYSIMRHFAARLLADGFDVEYYEEAEDFPTALGQYQAKHPGSRFVMMQQSEFGSQQYLSSFLDPQAAVEILPHCNFISNSEEFEQLHKMHKSERVTMETFYRLMRKKSGLLMDGSDPEGGQWNYDKENRKPP